jgi:hypothetical protein
MCVFYVHGVLAVPFVPVFRTSVAAALTYVIPSMYGTHHQKPDGGSRVRLPDSLSAYFKSRISGRICITFYMNVVPLDAILTACILIPYM